jgi:uncharacterized protein
MLRATWYFIEPDGTVRVSVYAQPHASKTEVAGLHDGALKIRVAAPALEDKANRELTRFLALCFSVPRRNVTLLRGEKSRAKNFAIRGSATNPATLLPC